MPSPAKNSKRDNLNIRLTPEQKESIARAAEIKHTTISNFVLERALEAAQEIVVEQRHFVMSADNWKTFCDALEGAPRDYPRLRKLLNEPSVFEK